MLTVSSPSARTVRIEVTAEDIRRGAPCIMTCCPLAIAVRRATGIQGVYVSHSDVRLFPKSLSGEVFSVQLPERITHWIKAFDWANSRRARADLSPIAFDLVLPGGVA